MDSIRSEFSFLEASAFVERSRWSFTADRLIAERPEAGEKLGARSTDRPGLCCLSNIAVYPGAGLLLTQRNEVLGESTIYPALTMGTPRESTFQVLGTIDQPAMFLDGVYAEYFWHWMMEYLPRALVAEGAGFCGTYYLGNSAPPFASESLELLGIGSERIQSAPLFPVNCSQLWLVQPFTGTAGHGRAALEDFPDFILDLRSRLLAAVPSAPEGDRARRLYLRRRNEVRGRNVTNDDALSACMGEFGVERVDLATLPLSEQIQLTRSATLLIGPHGAGMVHTLFQPVGSSVLEFLSADFQPTTNHFLHRLLQHQYSTITGTRSTADLRHPNLADFEIDVENLRVALRSLVSDARPSEKPPGKESL